MTNNIDEITNLEQLDTALSRVDLSRRKSTAKAGIVAGAVERLIDSGFLHHAIDEVLARHGLKRPGSLTRWLKRGRKHAGEKYNDHALEHATVGFLGSKHALWSTVPHQTSSSVSRSTSPAQIEAKGREDEIAANARERIRPFSSLDKRKPEPNETNEEAETEAFIKDAKARNLRRPTNSRALGTTMAAQILRDKQSNLDPNK